VTATALALTPSFEVTPVAVSVPIVPGVNFRVTVAVPDMWADIKVGQADRAFVWMSDTTWSWI